MNSGQTDIYISLYLHGKKCVCVFFVFFFQVLPILRIVTMTSLMSDHPDERSPLSGNHFFWKSFRSYFQENEPLTMDHLSFEATIAGFLG